MPMLMPKELANNPKPDIFTNNFFDGVCPNPLIHVRNWPYIGQVWSAFLSININIYVDNITHKILHWN